MDPGPHDVYVGWADRFARHLSDERPGLLYANLAVRGQTTAEVRATQLEPRARPCGPTSRCSSPASTTCSVRGSTRSACATTCSRCTAALHGSGATVLSFTMPDMSPGRAPVPCAAAPDRVPQRGGPGGGCDVRHRRRGLRDGARSPATRRCGTTTGCTPTARGTGGSPRRSPSAFGLDGRGLACRARGERGQRHRSGSSRARRTGWRRTWLPGSGDASAATSSRPAACASGPTCCRSTRAAPRPDLDARPPGYR